ncbi:SGNH/GDSL hydrolase family protein [Acinetobacter sp. YH12116]|uniref:SGNH/GDSL hydrolase family protein n=1 Tax=Acinetobacter sp. YH12116 TaxID=2601103 RepID=UPI0015D31115|nr:SGNH/GDSL hydrolase family protein [Acinetobacter sp. YH12116]
MPLPTVAEITDPTATNTQMKQRLGQLAENVASLDLVTLNALFKPKIVAEETDLNTFTELGYHFFPASTVVTNKPTQITGAFLVRNIVYANSIYQEIETHDQRFLLRRTTDLGVTWTMFKELDSVESVEQKIKSNSNVLNDNIAKVGHGALENKLLNPSFENDLNDWTKHQASTVALIKQSGIDGGKYLNISATAESASVSQDIPFAQNDVIYVSVWSRLNSGSNSTLEVSERLTISDYGTSLNAVRPKFIASDGAWERVSGIKKVNSTNGIRVSIGRGVSLTYDADFDALVCVNLTEIFGAGKEPSLSWFENTFLSAIDKTLFNTKSFSSKQVRLLGEMQTAAFNKCLNSSFENDFDGWKKNQDGAALTTTTSDFKIGAKSLSLNVVAQNSYLTQKVAFENDHVIYVGCWSKLISTDGNNAEQRDSSLSLTNYLDTAGAQRAIFSSNIGQWDFASCIKTVTDGGVTIMIGRGGVFTFNRLYDGVVLLDLTEIFGAGSELQASDVDELLSSLFLSNYFDYFASIKPGSIAKAVSGSATESLNWWKGKTVNFIGDSITEAAAGVYNYSDVAGATLKFTPINYGIGGSTIAQKASNPSERNPISTRYTLMDDADAVVVAAGTNDWQYSHTPFGTMSDRTVNTFYGALHVLCQGMLVKYLGKPFFFMTPIKRSQSPLDADNAVNTEGKTLRDYADAIIEVANFYGIPVLDMNRESMLDPHISEIYTSYMPDGTHPNRQGLAIMARRLTGFMKQLA